MICFVLVLARAPIYHAPHGHSVHCFARIDLQPRVLNCFVCDRGSVKSRASFSFLEVRATPSESSPSLNSESAMPVRSLRALGTEVDDDGHGTQVPQETIDALLGGPSASAAQPKAKARGRPKGSGKAQAGPKAKAKARVRQRACGSDDSNCDCDSEDVGSASEGRARADKCKTCKKTKTKQEFKARQNSCKPCVNGDRALVRLAETQGKTAWLTDLKATKPKQYAKLHAAYMKSELGSNGRRNFCLHTYIETLEAATGTRNEDKKKLMWEGEYLEFAKSAKGGYLSSAEAGSNWEAWKANPSHPRDNKGSRGFLRLLVTKGSYCSDYSDFSKRNILESREKGKKELASKDWDMMKRRLLSGHGVGSGVDFEGIREAVRAGGSSDRGDVFIDEGILGLDLQSLLPDPVAPSLKRRKHADSAENDEAEAATDDEEIAAMNEGVESEGGLSKPKWWDSERAIAKCERDFQIKDVTQLEVLIEKLAQSMKATLNEFRADPDKESFVAEMRIVMSRNRALELVQGSDSSALAKYIGNFELDGPLSPQRSTGSTSSRDLVQASRAGPCPHYKKLQTLARFKTNTFLHCSSPEEIKTVKSSIMEQRGVFNSLLKSCKAAMQDLYNARSALRNNREKKNKLEAEEARQRALAAKGAKKHRADAGVQLFDFDPKAGRSSCTLTPSDDRTTITIGAPALMSCKDLPEALLEKLRKEVACFKEEFQQSDIKVTQGRAQLPIENTEASKALRDYLVGKLPEDSIIEVDTGMAEALGLAKFKEVETPAVYGAAENHVHVRLDLAGLASLRLIFQGTRTVALCRLSDVHTFLMSITKDKPEAQRVSTALCYAWLKAASAHQLQSFLDAGNKFWWATVGPYDALYMPTGTICAERVCNLEDSLGVKVAFLARPAQDFKAKRELTVIADELTAAGKKDTATHQALSLFAHVEQFENAKSKNIVPVQVAAPHVEPEVMVGIANVPRAEQQEEEKDKEDMSCAPRAEQEDGTCSADDNGALNPSVSHEDGAQDTTGEELRGEHGDQRAHGEDNGVENRGEQIAADHGDNQ